MKRPKHIIFSPNYWGLHIIVIAGALAGISLYAFIESQAVSYLSDDPKTCVNCHVMTPQYATWLNSSHRKVASCNDCHVPHDNIVNTYSFKAKDGLYHASVFTARKEPEVIRIKDAGARVVQDNCIRCHKNQITDAKLSASVDNHFQNRTARKCWECHQEVPHGSVSSLSSINYLGKVPKEHYQTVPEWLNKLMKKSETEN